MEERGSSMREEVGRGVPVWARVLGYWKEHWLRSWEFSLL
jgi:hypothetical protein